MNKMRNNAINYFSFYLYLLFHPLFLLFTTHLKRLCLLSDYHFLFIQGTETSLQLNTQSCCKNHAREEFIRNTIFGTVVSIKNSIHIYLFFPHSMSPECPAMSYITDKFVKYVDSYL